MSARAKSSDLEPHLRAPFAPDHRGAWPLADAVGWLLRSPATAGEIVAKAGSYPLVLPAGGVCCGSHRGDRDMIDSGSPDGNLNPMAPDLPRPRRVAPREGPHFVAGRWRPDLALVLAVALTWPAVCCLCVMTAASFAHAADDAAAGREAPLPAWPLRSLSPAEERALQPADHFKECASCPEMVVIPAGRFLMGSARGEGDRDEEGPGGQPFTVTIGAPYALGRYLITVRDYLACVAETACPPPAWRDPTSPFNATTGVDEHYRRLGDALTNPSHPIVGITWKDAQSFMG